MSTAWYNPFFYSKIHVPIFSGTETFVAIISMDLPLNAYFGKVIDNHMDNRKMLNSDHQDLTCLNS